MRALVLALCLLAAALLAAASPAAAADRLGLTCAGEEGVQQCSGKVPTFDGVPIDLNVTLPGDGSGTYPLVILSHGWGGQKYPLKSSDPDDVSTSSLPWAQRGYAVLSITSRGFNGSCGTPPNRVALGCEKGWIRLDDTRYEVRDVQYFAGRLVDDGLVAPDRIGVHGGSYGGGVSNALALLKDRIMVGEDGYEPWTSPEGAQLSLAAAAPYIPWTDLVYSLVPNGRSIDYLLDRPRESRDPAGVMKQSFVSGLYALGNTTGFYSPPGADPDADLNRWYATISAGEPYDGNPAIQELSDEIYTHHSSISIRRDRPPAPIFIANGWTDDLFPVDEALRLANVMAAEFPQVPFAQMHFDFGHQRGQNKTADVARYREQVVRWMDRYVKGDSAVQAPTGVQTLTQTCPKDAPSGGPFAAPSWEEIHPGEVRFRAGGSQSVSNAGGNPDVARTVDPIAGGGACAQTDASDEPGTVNYRLPAAGGQGYTLMGSPTVIADVATAGAFPQLNARLWDVAPDGRQTLVARSVWRPEAGGDKVFQLHPNGYRFARGHVAKLQLLGRDAPYTRPSNGAFTVTVSDLELRLPVAERPGAADGDVRQPAPYVVPPGRTLAPGARRGSTPPRPARRRTASRRLILVAGCRGARVRGRAIRSVKRVTITRAGMRRRHDGRRPFRVRLRGHGRTVRALVVLRNGRSVRLRTVVPRSCL